MLIAGMPEQAEQHKQGIRSALMADMLLADIIQLSAIILAAGIVLQSVFGISFPAVIAGLIAIFALVELYRTKKEGEEHRTAHPAQDERHAGPF